MGDLLGETFKKWTISPYKRGRKKIENEERIMGMEKLLFGANFYNYNYLTFKNERILDDLFPYGTKK